MIESGALRPEAILPSTRDLARQLGVARMTVVEAYDWLGNLGYLETRKRSHTRVCALPLASGPRRGSAAESQSAPISAPTIDFRSGVPDLKAFPRNEWLAALVRAGRRLPEDSLSYGDVAGNRRLRQAIADYLRRARGLDVEPATIVITAGTAQSLDILLRAVPAPAEVVVEDPVPEALTLLPSTYGVPLRKVPADEGGLDTDHLPALPMPRLAYVIPSHQFPLGGMMPVERRLALIAWAQRTAAYVVEDDYDSEFAYDGRPAIPLARLDQTGRVIYAGTFSKTLAPSLRIGFMIVPSDLRARVLALKRWVDYGGNMLQQEALAEWIDRGFFERHVRRMRKIYHAKYRALTATLQQSFGGRVRIVGEPVGMHLAAFITTRHDVDQFVAACLAVGVRVYPLPASPHLQQPGEIGLVFGFGNLDLAAIVAGIQLIAGAD